MEDNDQEREGLLRSRNSRSQDQSYFQTIWQSIKEGIRGICDYQARKQMLIRDRRLGYVYYLCFLLIALYLIIYVIIIEKKYLDLEKANGYVFAQLIGRAVSNFNESYAWDLAEQNPWGGETNSVFIPSKITVTKRQTHGICPDPFLTCETDEDCTPYDIPNVVETSYCAELYEGYKGCATWRWCPSENGINSTAYYLEGASEQVVWAQYNLKFSRIVDKSVQGFSEDIIKYPSLNYNAWEVSDLTQLAGSNFSDIVEKGALYSANLVVSCVNLFGEECDNYLEIERQEGVEGNGYSISYAHYYRSDDILFRDLYHMRGVKIVFRSLGIYRTISLYNTILQFASALGLLIAANKLTDTIMRTCFKEKKHMIDLKCKPTPDLNPDDDDED